MTAAIRDVARACGVHISTVSRAFSAPHLVNAKTRARVLATAAQLGYRPNRAASALTTGRTYNLGLIVADIANPYFPPMIKSAQAQARRQGYHVYVADTEEGADSEEELVRGMAKQVDGVLLGSPRVSNHVVEQLSTETPLVVVNRRAAGVPAVLMSVDNGVQQAVKHLSELGHSRLAFLAGPTGSWTNREKRRATASAAEAASLTLQVLGPNPPTQAAGEMAAQDVVDAGVTAVLCHNDVTALGLVEGLARLGVTVPDQISVVGIDDIMASRLTRPKLTTVHMPTVAAGRTAVDMLLQLVSDPDDAPAAQTTLETALVVRDSTAPPP